MKKYLLIVAVVAMGLSFVACGGNKGESAKASDEAQQEEVVATTAEEGDLLTRYEALIDKAIELQEKVKSGDVAVVEEYTKLSEEMATLATELQNEAPNFTQEQAQKWAELTQKLAEAAQ